MIHISCDDGSTNVKLAWIDKEEVHTAISANSFRLGWKVDFGGAYNYQVGELKYSWDNVRSDAVPTTNVEYQYGDLNLLGVHHALLTSPLEPQSVALTVTLPLSEYYDQDCQKNTVNIERKRKNLMRPISLNKKNLFTIEDVVVMPESLPAAFSRLAQLQPDSNETTLIIDLGGTTLDAGVIVGQFEDISEIHGHPGIGVSNVTRVAQAALRAAETETSPLIADKVIQNRKDRVFLERIINEPSKINYVVEKIESAIVALGAQIVNELAPFRNVNRVLLVGGGATLIETAVRQAWPLSAERIEIVPDPQLALAREIALYKNEE